MPAVRAMAIFYCLHQHTTSEHDRLQNDDADLAHNGGVTIKILWVLVRIWDQLTKISRVDTLQS